MKNKLLPLLFVLGSYATYSQVVIGKQEVTPSAQLEVFANDKGVLIPRVQLTSTTDKTTIKNGNVESLLVFNTQAISDIVPGYYYWYNNKWNKIIVSGESNGVVAGNGAPGKRGEAGYPGENVTLYTDKLSGTVYVQNEDGTWTAINGKNGLDGKNGVAGGNGVPGASGTPGIDGTVQMYVDYNTGIIYVRDPKDNSKWISINGTNGIDGKNGIAGDKGLPGDKGLDSTIQMYVDYNTGIIYVRDPKDNSKWISINGKNGIDGKNGIAGDKGLPGDKGLDGTVQMYIDYDTGIVYVRDPKNPDKWIPVSGLNGIAGANGAPGTPGSITTLDAIVKDPQGNIYAYVGEDKTIVGRDAEWAAKSPNWVKINGLDGRDGKDGVVGGKGAPGAKGEPGYPGDSVAMYIDNETGTVYVRDPKNPDKWISITGKNGIDGIAGVNGAPGTPGSITTLDAIVKDPQGNIYAYIGDNNTVAGRDAEWAAKSPNWVKINGLDGRDGKDGVVGGKGAPGAKGEPGYPGDSVAMYIDNETGTVYVRDPENPDKWISITGKNGLDGKNGIAGDKGLPGDKGLDATIQMYVDYETGIVYVRDPKDNSKWVALNGTNGIDGKNGIAGDKGLPGDKGLDGTVQMYIDYDTGIVYVRDPKSPDKWIPISGLDGIAGANGAPGTPGSITTLDAIVKDPQGNIYAYIGEDKTIAGRDAEWAAKSTNWVKINGLDGRDGKDGVVGGKGAPGAKGEPGYPGDSVAMYIDNETGTVYVRDPENPDKWISITGKNGIDGKNGIAGDKGLPGDKGLDATIQMYIDYETGTVYVRDPKNSNIWIPANKETLTSLKDVVTQKEDDRGQLYDVHTLTYTDESGTANPIDMSVLVKGAETLTSLEYDASKGELNYKDEKGDVANFKLTDLVGEAQTLTKLEVNSDKGTLDYTDENKDTTALNLSDVVKEPWFSVENNKGATLNSEDIYTQGWVGIGFDKKSDAPNEKLRVNGAITTVNSYYADYVFEDYFKGFSDIKSDYKFKKLDEVDAFIKKNKHLPGITPINELVKTKEGYSFNVSELSIQLLEKTEELYLHIIEQDKELEAKNNEIQSLKASTEEMSKRLEKLEKLMSEKK